MPPGMKIIIFEFFALIKCLLFTISILGILDLANRKNLVQAIVQRTLACSKYFRCARSSIPKMEKINEKSFTSDKKNIIYFNFDVVVIGTFWHIWRIFCRKGKKN